MYFEGNYFNEKFGIMILKNKRGELNAIFLTVPWAKTNFLCVCSVQQVRIWARIGSILLKHATVLSGSVCTGYQQDICHENGAEKVHENQVKTRKYLEQDSSSAVLL